MTASTNATAHPDLGHLDGIGRGDLDQAAALQDRRDRKYIVPVEDIPVLLDATPAPVHALDVDGQRAFRYQSIYFDTADLRCYQLAATRRPRRYKVRTRTYLDTRTAMIEVKERSGPTRTIKHRQPRATASPDELLDTDRAFVAGYAALIPAEDQNSLRAVLTSRYVRSTLFLPLSQTRVTIDTSLRCHTSCGPTVGVHRYAIIETKTTGRATEFDRALWSLGHRPTSFSKYATMLAALIPELPANKWSRVLDRYLGRHPSWATPSRLSSTRELLPNLRPDGREMATKRQHSSPEPAARKPR